MSKERNYVVLAMLKMHKRTTIHGKSNKAKRRKDKVQTLKEWK